MDQCFQPCHLYLDFQMIDDVAVSSLDTTQLASAVPIVDGDGTRALFGCAHLCTYVRSETAKGRGHERASNLKHRIL